MLCTVLAIVIMIGLCGAIFILPIIGITHFGVNPLYGLLIDVAFAIIFFFLVTDNDGFN